MNAYAILLLAIILAPVLVISSDRYPRWMPWLVGLPPILGIVTRMFVDTLALARSIIGTHYESLVEPFLAYEGVMGPFLGLFTLIIAVPMIASQAAHRHGGSGRTKTSHLAAMQLSLAATWFGSGLHLVWSDAFWAGMGYGLLAGMVVGVVPEIGLVLLTRSGAYRSERRAGGPDADAGGSPA